MTKPTQSSVAKKYGVSIQFISRVALDRDPCPPRMLVDIAEVRGVDPIPLLLDYAEKRSVVPVGKADGPELELMCKLAAGAKLAVVTELVATKDPEEADALICESLELHSETFRRLAGQEEP